MTTANGTLNSRTARKSLADQLDRFDAMLDGLSEAIPEVVADSVKAVIAQAVSEAVHAAVAEVLSRPELLRAALQTHVPVATLSAQPPAQGPKPPTMKEKVVGIASRLCEKVKRAASQAREKLTEVAATARAVGRRSVEVAAIAPVVLGALARKAWECRKPFAVAVGVGVACGAVCYLGGQLFASIANGMSATAVTLSALTLPFKRLFWGDDS